MKPITILFCCLISLNILGQDLKTALNLINSQQFEEAEKMLEDLIKTDPANGNLYYYYGDALLKDYLADTISNSKEEFAKKAEALFRQGIQQAPSNALNHVGLGAVELLRTSDTTKADEHFKIAEAAVPVKLKKKEYTPERANILTNLAAAQMYGKNNRFKKAVDYCERAKVINPNDPNIYLTLGDVYIKSNDASKALFNYNQALNKDPKSPLPKIMIGNIYMRVPNLQAARPYFEDALEIDSTFAPVYRSLGELWTKGGRYDLAKQYFYKYMQLSGNTIPAKIRYGNSLFRSNDFTGAFEVIEEILKVDNSRNYLNRIAGYSAYEIKPQKTETLEKGRQYMETFFENASTEDIIARDYSYYGRILFSLANRDSATLDKAFDNLNKAYAMDESDRTLLTEIARNYYTSRRYEDAVRTFQLKAEKGWTDKNDQLFIARAYYNLKDYPNAEEAFNKLIENEPENVEAHLYLARIASFLDPENEQGLALPRFEKVISLIGAETEKHRTALLDAYNFISYYYLSKDEYDTAKEWYKKYEELDPANKDLKLKALNGYAIIAFRQKNYVATRDYYREILALDPNNKEIQQGIQNLNKVIAAQK